MMYTFTFGKKSGVCVCVERKRDRKKRLALGESG